MQLVVPQRLGLFAAALIVVAGSLTATALFEASQPGADLSPIGGAEEVITIVQGSSALSWTSLAGPVRIYKAVGWPSTDGYSELGGALVMENVDGATSGVIDLGEKPRTVEFVLGD